MTYVAQQHSMSCGIASVANALGITYENAAKHFDMRFADTRGYFCKSIVVACRKLGAEYRFSKIRLQTQHLIKRTGAIVFVDVSETLPYGHWLARVDAGYVDSWINMATEADCTKAIAGMRGQLPGIPSWVVYPVE